MLTLKLLYSIQNFKLTFKVSSREHWLYHNSAQFSEIRKYKKIIIRMWSFSFLTHVEFTSELNFINRNHSLCCWCCCRKYESCLRKTHVLNWPKYLGKIILTGCLLFRVCCSAIFNSFCFFPCPYLFSD